MKNEKLKSFKAVDFMRKRREELSDLYNSNPMGFLKKLEQVQKKYRNKFHVSAKQQA
ncbi:MAG: hypothetical protein SFU87_16335 [Chitinophagaceae bacterium]|nr:hypothetical protein [Chitinophagaceae bacterium]